MPLSLKVVFIGDSKVGKTAVMRRFLGEFFDPVFIMTTSGGWYNSLYKFHQEITRSFIYFVWDEEALLPYHFGTTN